MVEGAFFWSAVSSFKYYNQMTILGFSKLENNSLKVLDISDAKLSSYNILKHHVLRVVN